MHCFLNNIVYEYQHFLCIIVYLHQHFKALMFIFISIVVLPKPYEVSLYVL